MLQDDDEDPDAVRWDGGVARNARRGSWSGVSQTAALMADWPDVTSGNVSINERGSNVLRAYHVTRRGTRLTIFDRVDRQDRTFHVLRSGTVVTVWDPSSASRESYVAHVVEALS